PAPGCADAILLGPTNGATGINSLLVDGTLYNVTFVHGTYANVYPSGTTPIFAGNSSLAADAATALAAALTSFGVTDLTGAIPEPVPGGTEVFAYIPDVTATGLFGEVSARSLNSSWTLG